MKRKMLGSAAAVAFVSAFALTPSFAQVSSDQDSDASSSANSNAGTADSGLSDAMKANPDNYVTGMYVIDKKSGTVYLIMPDQAQPGAADESKSDESDQPAVPPTSKSGLTHWMETPILLA